MVEGVEDMQILYGEDTDADNVANRYVPSDEVGSMENVVSVRISLLLRSVENNLTTAPAPYTYMGTTTTPPSGRPLPAQGVQRDHQRAQRRLRSD